MLDMDRVRALAKKMNEKVYPGIRSDEDKFQRVKRMFQEEEHDIEIIEQEEIESFIPMSFEEAVQSRVWAAILQENIYEHVELASSQFFQQVKQQDIYYFKQEVISSIEQTLEQNTVDVETVLYAKISKKDEKSIDKLKEGDEEITSPSLLYAY
ncbi:hypothetical protein RKS58_02665 [Lysinibacillus capsici]|uniref:hypothetical protein n=1 Tax=Lysinibacillus capsici TaxID=2115968 RepID=UPI0028BDB03F|nr:hypothetical protein [Lysinibacillus capsici]WNN76753.1 hypothetical protein RKS58_02665 [Lysinibacillus capsici]